MQPIPFVRLGEFYINLASITYVRAFHPPFRPTVVQLHFSGDGEPLELDGNLANNVVKILTEIINPA